MHFIDPYEGWIVGKHGIALHTTDSGSDWSSRETGVTENLHAICFSEPREGWIVGQDGLVLHTTDGGTNWKIENAQTDQDLYDIKSFGKNNLIAIGAGGTIIRRTLVDAPL